MIEFLDANDFIERFEKVYNKKIFRIPYTKKNGERVTILMCYCGRRWISLPYFSLGVIEKKTTDKLFIQIDLTKQDNILNLFSSNIKRKINKSKKDGVIIKYGTNKSLIKQFYQAYTHRMKEINIATCGKNTIEKDVAFGGCIVFVAYFNNKIVGGSTLTKFNNENYANSLFATIKQYNKHYVSYALHYAMMNYIKQNNGRFYSLGRSTRNSSVYNYKRHFKGEEIALYWSYSFKKKNIRDRKILYSLWKILPYNLTKIIGPLIAKHIY
ncbi:MAG: hypothetical protein LKE30_02430 [Bacteroidales bacterium]|jgi:lipid II:glycine glycyltransferase (peptidoglycan interpeptide bridge formation enzyme)|nr:hypothetical protein [Bacteroidales bacterium]